jgi:hypothetical protein
MLVSGLEGDKSVLFSCLRVKKLTAISVRYRELVEFVDW